MSVEDKSTLLDMLERNGVMVSDESSLQEVLNATFIAIRESPKFRQELSDYFVQQGTSDTEDMSEEFSNAKGEGWNKVKGFFKNVFSEENVSKGIGIGMDYLGSSLQAKANKGLGQQAIQLETLKAQTAANEAAKIDALSKLPPTSSGTPKWVLPVAIGGGVLLIGTILFFVLRKK
jgi:hypothetical protein